MDLKMKWTERREPITESTDIVLVGDAAVPGARRLMAGDLLKFRGSGGPPTIALKIGEHEFFRFTPKFRLGNPLTMNNHTRE